MKPRKQVLMIVCVLASAVLMMPAISAAQCGCQSYAAPVAMAPAYAPAYTSYAVPTTAYMPTAVYRALYQPAVTTAYMPVYQPAVAYAPTTSYAVSTYRPLFGWNYRTRLVPYTTYQPIYSPAPVVAYSGCSTCANYGSYNGCSSCSSGACGTTVNYETPASSCSSCAAPATVVTPSPAAPSYAPNATPPKTFQEEKAQKPSTEEELKPIPQGDTHLNSMPSPLLPDPRDRTASRAVYTSARVTLVANPTPSNDGWQPARD
jgi:hypothetical protein